MKRLFRSDLLYVALLIGLCWLSYWRLITPIAANQQSFVEGDFSGQFVAFAQYQAERFAQGQVPLWNPYNLGGHPFLADTQSAVFYPPRLVTIGLLNATGGSDPFRMYDALQKEVAAHTLIASILMYALLRRMTGARNYSQAASLVGAITFAYGGYLTSYPQLQVAVIEAGVWLPLALLGFFEGTRVDIDIDDRLLQRGRWFVLAGVALGLSFLAGHPQTTLFFLYTTTIYLLWRVFSNRLSWRVFILGAVVMGLVGGGLAAVQLVPGLEYLSRTTRIDLNVDAKGNGFPFYDVLQMLFPGMVSLWSPLYFGIVGLMLALVALWRARQDREVLFWSVLAFGALLLSFGRGTIFYDLAYNLVPGFSLFRGQERSAYVIALCTAVLVSFGTQVWLDDGLPARFGRWCWGLVVLAAVLFGVLFAHWLIVRDADTRQLGLVAFSVLIAALGAWLLTRFTVTRWKAAALIALVAFELLSFGRTNPNLEAKPVTDHFKDNFAVSYLHGASNVQRIDSLRENYGTLYGLMDVQGISPLRLASVDAVLNLPPSRQWDVMGVRYVITPDEQLPVPSTIIMQSDNPYNPFKLHELSDPRPLARLVYRTWIEPNTDAAKGIMSDPSYDARHTVMLTATPAVTLPADAPTDPAPSIVTFAPERLELTLNNSTPALLEVSLVNYPGWEAALDGQPIPMMTADLAMIAIPIQAAGEHQVTLIYNPRSYQLGAIMSLAVLAVVIVVAIGGLLGSFRTSRSAA